MALVGDYNPTSLQDVLGQQAQARTAQTQDQITQGRKRLVSQQAASGRLMSGVADYPLTDYDTRGVSELSGIQGDLASKLGGISAEDWLNQQGYGRSYGLANLIGNLNKPSTLDEVFRGIGALGPTAIMAGALL